MKTMLLAIDTSTKFSGIALFDGEKILAEENWFSRESHTLQLMPRIVRMMETQGLKPADLKAIGVALGPGSFTGLRIGMAVAKGLALSLKIDLVGVPTLDFLAYPLSYQPLPVWSVLEAGRGRIYTAGYKRVGKRWKRLTEYMALAWEELPSRVQNGSFIFCGEIDQYGRDFIEEVFGKRAKVADPAFSLRRAGFLAQMAYQLWLSSHKDDPASLSPIYLKGI
ncbi:MAG: tRNA (adenosine(37)-N6)-threonylcarbamoyltransferase complex dimerization subunit type 1 TsaB [Anaerolineae bacterium]|nr:tRNA (adenosine(37)-N6)-threonylcarbamoyltransferase complex dimerization subunit type 1 TsaB [Anaerolineae bacterium]MDW8101376.1 tRNA (adenosine(37)-N6)-threonylcarbamoyltransferase complex dimerization subunit type 1 TsaB [Anaerolineae bacterium]